MTNGINENGVIPKWLDWARQIQAIAQTGLAFNNSEYDIERFNKLHQIAANIIQEHSKLEQDHLLQNFIKQKGYATPKIDVRGAIVKKGRILLVQERSDQLWCMPGGWADVGESPIESVTREIWEESGFHSKVIKVVGVFDANRSGRDLELYHAFKIVFLCEINGGTAKTSNETQAVEFFSFDDLPPLSQNRTNKLHLEQVQKHLNDPNYPTFFN